MASLSLSRSSNPQFNASTKTLHVQFTHSPAFPSSFPRRQDGNEIGGTKGKHHGLRSKQFAGNSNEIRKLTVTATTLMTEGTRKEQFTQKTPGFFCHTHSGRNLFSPKEFLFPTFHNDVMQYRITFWSWICPLLTSAKINLVLDKTRTSSSLKYPVHAMKQTAFSVPFISNQPIMVPILKFKNIELLSQSWFMSSIPENMSRNRQGGTSVLLRSGFLSQEQSKLSSLTNIDFLSPFITTDRACLI